MTDRLVRPTLLRMIVLFLLAPASTASADFLASSLGPNFFDGSVLRYDSDGNQLTAGDIPGFTAGLGFSQGVIVGPGGNIYVSSNNLISGAGEILFFDPSGNPLSHDGGQPGLFATLPFNPPAEEGGNPTPPSPAGLTFGPNGNLYVADREGSTVRVFDGTTGTQLADAATGLQTPTALAFGPDGALYVSEFNAGRVTRVENGAQTTFIAPSLAGPYTPSSLLWLQTGNVLVVDLFANQILEFDGSGNLAGQFAVVTPEIPDPLPPGANIPSNNPSQIIYDEDGNLVLSVLGLTNPPDNRGALLKYDLEGNLLETITDGRMGMGAVAWIASADAVTGDYNGDGNVDGEDYDKWNTDFGKWVAKGGGADGNGNGVVDAADYTVWRDVFSVDILVGAGGAATVPEPAAGLMVITGIALAAGLRRRS